MSEARNHNALRDERVAAALRATHAEPPFDSVDWDRLHAGILDAARPRLDGSPMRWWEPLSSWTARGIPAAAAAILVLALGIIFPWSSFRPTDSADVTIEDELVAGLPEAQQPLLFADTDVDALLHLVLYYNGEER